jgi:hypothetical protein
MGICARPMAFCRPACTGKSAQPVSRQQTNFKVTLRIESHACTFHPACSSTLSQGRNRLNVHASSIHQRERLPHGGDAWRARAHVAAVSNILNSDHETPPAVPGRPPCNESECRGKQVDEHDTTDGIPIMPTGNCAHVVAPAATMPLHLDRNRVHRIIRRQFIEERPVDTRTTHCSGR